MKDVTEDTAKTRDAAQVPIVPTQDDAAADVIAGSDVAEADAETMARSVDTPGLPARRTRQRGGRNRRSAPRETDVSLGAEASGTPAGGAETVGAVPVQDVEAQETVINQGDAGEAEAADAGVEAGEPRGRRRRNRRNNRSRREPNHTTESGVTCGCRTAEPGECRTGCRPVCRRPFRLLPCLVVVERTRSI